MLILFLSKRRISRNRFTWKRMGTELKLIQILILVAALENLRLVRASKS